MAQQNSKILKDAIRCMVYLDRWFQDSTLPIKSVYRIVTVTIVLLLGSGLIFWASELKPFPIPRNNDQTELEVARTGLQTMKRMVNDQQAWSQSIKEEYEKLSKRWVMSENFNTAKANP